MWRTREPADATPALEQAEEEFAAGHLEENFVEEFLSAMEDGHDYEIREGDYEQRLRQAERAAESAEDFRAGWRAYRDTLADLMPRTFEAAREATIDARFDELCFERCA